MAEEAKEKVGPRGVVVPVCQWEGCEVPVTVPKRGRIPAYCSAAHKQAAFRALKKAVAP